MRTKDANVKNDLSVEEEQLSCSSFYALKLHKRKVLCNFVKEEGDC